MNPKRVKAFLNRAIENPEDTPPVFLEGPPGIGKSAIPLEVAQGAGIGFIDMRLVHKDPTDLRGIPVPQDGSAVWLPPSDLPASGRGILFLDELTSAPPLVQASAYQLTFDRKLGEYQLPEGWYIIAAGNRIEDRAVVHRMSSALNNRFIHINFEPSLDDWTEWALSVGIDANVVSFLHFRPELLFQFNPESSEKAFPSPRTWDFADRVIKVAGKDILAEVLEGTIGKGAAAEFIAFLKVQTELPDLQKIFDGDNFVPARMDLKYAIVSALASRARGNQFERLLQYSAHLPAEFAVLMVSMLISRDGKAVSAAPSWKKWAKDHSGVVVNREML